MHHKQMKVCIYVKGWQGGCGLGVEDLGSPGHKGSTSPEL